MTQVYTRDEREAAARRGQWERTVRALSDQIEPFDRDDFAVPFYEISGLGALRMAM